MAKRSLVGSANRLLLKAKAYNIDYKEQMIRAYFYKVYAYSEINGIHSLMRK